MTKMRAARMYGYRQPLVLEEIPIPDIGPSEVLVKVGGAGMCRTDFQLIDGYFHSNLPVDFPVTPGHEIAGTIDRIGSAVPAPRVFPRAIQSSSSVPTGTARAVSATAATNRSVTTEAGWGSVPTAVIRSTSRSSTSS